VNDLPYNYNPASPLGMASGGYMPSAMDRFQNDMMRNIAVGQSYGLAMDDPRTRYFTEQAAKIMFGKDFKKKLTADEGKLMQSVAAWVADGKLGGGSTTNMLAAAHNGAAAGFTVKGEQGTGFAAGMGPLSLAAGRMTADALQRHFAYQSTGAQRLERTAGVGRDGLAGVYTAATARGMLGPVEMETFGEAKYNRDGSIRMTAADSAREDIRRLEDRRARQIKEGQTDLAETTSRTITQLQTNLKEGASDMRVRSLSPEYEKKMTTVVEQGAKALATVKNIFGNRSWTELAENLEAVTGMRAGAGADFGKMEQRFKQVKNRIEASGQNVATVMQTVVDAVNAAGGGVAGNIAGRATLSATTDLASAARMNGITGYDSRKAAMEIQTGIAATMQESITGAGELSALINGGGLSVPQEKKARELMQQFAGAKTLEDRMAADEKARGLLAEMGYTPGQLTATIGAEKVMELGGSVYMDAAEQSDRNLASNKTLREGLTAAFGADSLQGEVMTELSQKFSVSTLDRARAALAEGDTAGVRALLGEESAARAELAFGNGKAHRLGFGVNLLRQGMPGAAAALSEEDRKRIDQGAAARDLAQTLMPDANINMAGLEFSESLLQGLTTEKKLSPAQLAGLAATDTSLGAKDGVFRLGQLTSDSKGVRFGMTDEVRNALRSSMDEKSFADLTSGDPAKLQAALKTFGGAVGWDAEGGVTVTDKRGMARMRKRAGLIEGVQSELMKSEDWSKLSTESQASLINQLSQGAGISTATKENLLSTMQEKMKTQAAQDEKTPAMSGKGQFLGELRLVSGNNALISLFQQR